MTDQWEIVLSDPSEGFNGFWIERKKDHAQLAWSVGPQDDKDRASIAALLSAAPDMLAALKDAESCFDAMADEGYLNNYRRSVWSAMRSAIAKATDVAQSSGQ